MHKLAEKIADCLKAKVEGKGIDNIEGQDLVEFELWSKVIKNLVCYDKDKKIIEAMDEAEEAQEAMKYIEMYENYPEERKGYRGQPRNSKGQFMSRRSYESRMMPDMDYEEMERMRDYDRGAGKMYYSGSGSSGGSSSGMSSGGPSSSGMSSGSMGSNSGSRGYSESRYDRARRGYEETKAMHNSGSAEDKQLTMREAEKMVNVIFDELEESLSDAPKEVKDMIKNKGMAKLQKIQ